ncbi:unnamed protein product [Cylindrotheca closterium]|uniref:Uncharacterized protein n=1 Tax=Cylindrotheca closterium TaxID=2856 RepID=A0AAD2FZM9_9STRA|nr:unnamed protein product [Cylindrotheca closterium]
MMSTLQKILKRLWSHLGSNEVDLQRVQRALGFLVGLGQRHRKQSTISRMLFVYQETSSYNMNVFGTVSKVFSWCSGQRLVIDFGLALKNNSGLFGTPFLFVI